ncbi:MAG: FprA family A-type flavoprotein [Wolinella succinogenes]|uniref:FprA family A-type flavoprotein n=1 Tax=Wolinella succinogenes TaxID=844 RepID=UPI001695F3C0|nr:FprA family A-type flavoprotein [Wolinella succinogenes]NLU35276.1 FprA family A-type flavoprotein [Wolinella succinogenes]
MRTLLAPSVHWVGVKDPELAIFDIVVPTEHGTTYNSYLIQGSEKCALIDTSKANFSKEYFTHLEKHLPLQKIDYIVVQHTEPDHAGCLREFLERHPEVTLIHSKPCKRFIQTLTNLPFNSMAIESGDELDLGGKTLRFFSTPFLHWPDTMMSYLVEDKILFSCDVMGSHFTSETNPEIFNSLLDEKDYLASIEAFKYYYAMIMRPYKEHIIKAFELLEKLDVQMIAPSHGPILDMEPRFFFDWYRARAKNYLLRLNGQKVTIIYASAYGNTAKMMESVKAGLLDAGVEVAVFDASSSAMTEMIDSIELSTGILLGTSTINAKAPEPILHLIANLVVLSMNGRKAGVFGSFGWSGEGIAMTERICEVMKMKIVQEPYKVQMAPSSAQLEEGREWGYNFGLKIIE